MKDITIKGKYVKRELLVLLACFIVVNVLNVCAICQHDTCWREIYSVWYALIFVTVILYILLIPVRYLLCWAGKGVKALWARRKGK